MDAEIVTDDRIASHLRGAGSLIGTATTHSDWRKKRKPYKKGT